MSFSYLDKFFETRYENYYQPCMALQESWEIPMKKFTVNSGIFNSVVGRCQSLVLYNSFLRWQCVFLVDYMHISV